MNLPFVSRGRYDDARKQLDELKAEVSRLTAKSDALGIEVTELKVAAEKTKASQQRQQDAGPRGKLSPIDIAVRATAAKIKDHEAAKILAKA